MKALRNLFMTAIMVAAIMLIPAVAQAAITDGAIDYTGTEVNFIKADGDGFGMFAPQDGTTIAVEGENVVIHYVPKNVTTYGWIHWGLITDELTKDLTFNDDGTFDITLPKSVCGKGIPASPIKKEDGKTSKSQYYLAVPSEANLPTKEELTITNKLNMFKVVKAYLIKDGQNTTLQISLSGSGYKKLFAGTYEEAVANGNNPSEWIDGTPNAEGKLTFDININDKTYIPLVAISQTYLDKFTAGENPLARAFYPRQITIDSVAKSILVEDFKSTIDLKLTNNEKLLKPTAATLTTTGGPNSNGYTVTADITMANDDYNEMFIGDKAKAAAATSTIAIADGNVFKDVEVEKIITPGEPSSIESILDQASIISFKSKKDGSWMEVKTTISKKNRTIDFKTTAPAPKAQGPKVGSQASVGGYIYKVTSATTAALVKPSKKTYAKASIPALVKIKGKSLKVTSINAKAFKSNKKLKSLSIGKNVKTIGAGAFMGCVKLKSITLPASVTTIGSKAFYGCKKAKKLVIKGTAIKSFGKKSFAKTGIKKLTAPKKVKKAYKKKLIKAGVKKSVK